MSCTTAVKYDVREDILRNWLEAIFGVGETETGLIIWSCTAANIGNGSIWQVTAPREITSAELHQLKLASIPKKPPPFGMRKRNTA